VGLFDLIKGVWDLAIKPAPTPPKPPVTPQPDITTLTQDIEPQPKSQDEIKNEGLLKIRQKVLQQYTQWQERGQLRTQTNIEQYDTLQSPQPFWKLKSGESYEVYPCAHVACEGSGSFEVSQAQLNHYQRKNFKPPKSCYACRVWAHEHNLEGKVVGTCEVCQKPVTVTPRKWIGRHKFQGQPEFRMYCGNCKRITRQR